MEKDSVETEAVADDGTTETAPASEGQGDETSSASPPAPEAVGAGIAASTTDPGATTGPDAGSDSGGTHADGTVADTESPAGTETEGYLTAVLIMSGKQHFVRVGDDIEIRAETLDAISTEEPFEVTELLLAYQQGEDGRAPHNIAFGTPYLEGAKASLKFKSARRNKGVSFKKRRRKHASKTLRGYKNYTIRFSVEGLSVPGVGQETLVRSAGGETIEPAQ